MYKKYCSQCGKEFTTDSNRKRLCDACKAINKEKHNTEYMTRYKKEKRHTILITKEDYDILENLSAKTGLSKAKLIHALLLEIIDA